MTKTFIGQCIAGETTPDKIDDFIESWHRGIDRRRLSDAIGLSFAEYNKWLQDDNVLQDVINRRIKDV